MRTGLRWGGREPTLFPALAMELSGWYEGQFRTGSGTYGFGDRTVEPQSHLFWAEAMLAYTLPELKHSFYLSLTAGTSLNADRFSAYRLGSLLPLVSEFPLSLPGYYYQEISAREFVLVGGNYMMPLDQQQRWNLSATASTAVVDYLPWPRAAGPLAYRAWAAGFSTNRLRGKSWSDTGMAWMRSGRTAAARKASGCCSNSTWESQSALNSEQPSRWRGFQQLLNIFGSRPRPSPKPESQPGQQPEPRWRPVGVMRQPGAVDYK